ncbi:MAG: MoxR family ATPase [Deltaproteobacteria bacterium]
MTDTPRLLEVEPDERYALPPIGGREACPHVFDAQDIRAVNAALAASRPLLLRGLPGVGKSQLARAAAVHTGRAFVSKVVDARTESRDLLYTYDAVRRLARAQLQATPKFKDEVLLEERYFVEPGVLWWAFDWQGATEQRFRARFGEPPSAGDERLETLERPWHPDAFDAKRDGVVVLIDEIDKAEESVPNGLLEALGERRFDALGFEEVAQPGVPPLVVITTNEERTLPKAFLRRCVVHRMGKGDGYEDWLFDRGRAHFPDAAILSDDLVRTAAKQLATDRKRLSDLGLAAPGQAELIDLLRTLVVLGPVEAKRRGVSVSKAREELLDDVGEFFFDKNAKHET